MKPFLERFYRKIYRRVIIARSFPLPPMYENFIRYYRSLAPWGQRIYGFGRWI